MQHSIRSAPVSILQQRYTKTKQSCKDIPDPFFPNVFLILFFLQTQKLKHMAELQISVVTNDTHRSQILAQIRHWEDTLERMHCEQFRLRCYMASLQNGELPNPKVILRKFKYVVCRLFLMNCLRSVNFERTF